MDRTFYDDVQAAQQMRLSSVREVKAGLALNFSGDHPTKKSVVTDIDLTSPELERLMVHHEAATVSTPSTILGLFPKSVTQEQEDYALGFVKALEKLHRSNGLPSFAADDEPRVNTPRPTYADDLRPVAADVSHDRITDHVTTIIVPVLVNSSVSQPQLRLRPSVSTFAPKTEEVPLPSLLPFFSGSGAVVVSEIAPASGAAFHANRLIAGERRRRFPWLPHGETPPQTVPCVYGSSSPDSPPDDNDDDGRLETRRARNRLAAQKCRIRKIERIADLSAHVDELKEQNARLARMSSALRAQLDDVKRQLTQHVVSGCRVMIAASSNAPS